MITSHGRGWKARCLARAGVVLVMAGCAQLDNHVNASEPTCATAPTVPWSATTPSNLEPAFQESATGIGRVVPAAEPASAGPYRALVEQECQCLAARSSAEANLLDMEAQALDRRVSHCHLGASLPGARHKSLQRALLESRAQEARNNAAASALELYYRLAAAEARSVLLDASLSRTQETLAAFRAMKAQGLQPPADDEAMHRQELDLQRDRAELGLAADQLNRQLIQLLGADHGQACWQVWPVLQPVVDLQPIDVEEAVATGLARRPELRLLRRLSGELDAGTLSVAKKLLQSSNGLLGLASMSGPAHILQVVHLPGCGSQELDVRRQQIEQLRCEREKAIAGNIRQAATEMQIRARLVALASERSHSWQGKVQDLEAKHAQGMASAALLLAPTLEWLGARGDVVKEVTAWQIARVKLRQEQGLLAAECGCNPVDSCAEDARSPGSEHPHGAHFCLPILGDETDLTGAENKSCRAVP